MVGKPQCDTINRKSGGRRETRASVSSQVRAREDMEIEAMSESVKNLCVCFSTLVENMFLDYKFSFIFLTLQSSGAMQNSCSAS